MSVEVVTTRIVPFSPVRSDMSTVLRDSSTPSQMSSISCRVPSARLTARKAFSCRQSAALRASPFRKAKL